MLRAETGRLPAPASVPVRRSNAKPRSARLQDAFTPILLGVSHAMTATHARLEIRVVLEDVSARLSMAALQTAHAIRMRIATMAMVVQHQVVSAPSVSPMSAMDVSLVANASQAERPAAKAVSVVHRRHQN